jgi:hypothetical protein
MVAQMRELTEWRTTTDAVMSRIYGINTDDAGLDDEWLRSHWNAGETPDEFVRWFAQKYDLISKRSMGIDGW